MICLWQEESYEVSEDTVEMDELNKHECMAKMSALLKHLIQNKISPEQPKVFVQNVPFHMCRFFCVLLKVIKFLYNDLITPGVFAVNISYLLALKMVT